MALELYLGPLRAPIQSIAATLANLLSSIGLTPPPITQLTDAILITLVVILITALAAPILPALTQRDDRDAILILGISGDGDAPAVGKTALFKQLKNGRQPAFGTTTSMQPNDATFSPSSHENCSIRWVDFPGHPRLRPKLSQYLTKARGIVFVVDGSRFFAQARRDAELLYEVLTNATVSKKATPILIVANKADLTPTSVTPASIRTRLEAELDRTRAAQASSLQAVGVGDGDHNDMNERITLGYENEVFSFDHIPNEITLAQTSASLGEVSAIVVFAKSCRS